MNSKLRPERVGLAVAWGGGWGVVAAMVVLGVFGPAPTGSLFDYLAFATRPGAIGILAVCGVLGIATAWRGGMLDG